MKSSVRGFSSNNSLESKTVSCTETSGDASNIPSELTKTSKRTVSECYQNPYRNANEDDFQTITQRAKEWLGNEYSHMTYATSNMRLYSHNHERFWVFAPLSNCSDISCVGGACSADTSKMICGLDHLKLKQSISVKQQKQQQQEQQHPPCVVYSIGGNNKWEFENEILEKTPCDVHTFDCTGPISRFTHKPKHPRSFFHHVCLGTNTNLWNSSMNECQGNGICGDMWTMADMQERLNHSKIDLLKMDIEGFEWPIFESWPELEEEAQEETLLLPMQILVEVHYQSQFKELANVTKQDFKHPPDFVRLQSHFLKMGYAVVIRDDNPYCKHCTELTLTRFRCPS